MRIIKTIIILSSLSLIAACGGPTNQATVPEAEPAGASFVDIGDHVVHFSAQTTDNLPLEVAQTYNISRNPYSAMLNVSVLEDGTNTAVTAAVSVKTVNLTGQLKDVTMRMIQEQEAIYYIGVTDVANMETLIFDISVRPDGVDAASDVRFKRQFYTN
jgi:hypothetical protein